MKIKDFFLQASSCKFIYKFIEGDYIIIDEYSIYIDFYQSFIENCKNHHPINSKLIFLLEKDRHLKRLRRKDNLRFKEIVLSGSQQQFDASINESGDNNYILQYQIASGKNITYLETADMLICELENIHHYLQDKENKKEKNVKITKFKGKSSENFLCELLLKIPGVGFDIATALSKKYESISNLFLLLQDNKDLFDRFNQENKHSKLFVKSNIAKRIINCITSTELDAKICE